MSALLIVDVQNDFISGSLAISDCPAKHNGEEVRNQNLVRIISFESNIILQKMFPKIDPIDS